MDVIMLIGYMGLSACGGCLLGFLWKGNIDRRFEKKLQKSLIRVGQYADDEIEALQKENDRLHQTVTDLQIQLAERRKTV